MSNYILRAWSNIAGFFVKPSDGNESLLTALRPTSLKANYRINEPIFLGPSVNWIVKEGSFTAKHLMHIQYGDPSCSIAEVGCTIELKREYRIEPATKEPILAYCQDMTCRFNFVGPRPEYPTIPLIYASRPLPAIEAKQAPPEQFHLEEFGDHNKTILTVQSQAILLAIHTVTKVNETHTSRGEKLFNLLVEGNLLDLIYSSSS